MDVFTDFINEYGTAILYAIITALAGYIGIAIKNIYNKYVNTQTKKDIVKTVVQGIEQVYKDIHGEEKLNIALENAAEMLGEKGINVSDLELRMLIEAAVGEFNDAFHKTAALPEKAEVSE